jgi:hypothetical protein
LKATAKATKKTSVKKSDTIVKSSLSFWQWNFVGTFKRKTLHRVGGCTKNWPIAYSLCINQMTSSQFNYIFLQFVSPLFMWLMIRFFVRCKLLELFKIATYDPIVCVFETYLHWNIDTWDIKLPKHDNSKKNSIKIRQLRNPKLIYDYL